MKSKYYKHPTFGHVYGEMLATPIGRAAWPSLVTPKEPPPPQEGQAPGAPRYEMTILIPKTSPELPKFQAVVKSMTDEMLAMFNEGRSAKLGECSLMLDGDTVDLEKYPYYKGHMVLVARNPKAVEVKAPDAKTVLPADTVSGGCKVVAVVTPLVTAHGVSYRLNLVQFIEDDGTKFGGTRAQAETLLKALPTAAVAAQPASQPVASQAAPAASATTLANAVDLL